MKKAIFSLSLLCLIISGGIITLIHFKSNIENSSFPKPTEIIEEKNDADFKKAKAEWYEQMHMTAPGVNWRQIDNESRAVLREKRAELRRLKATETELFADGLLSGQWIEKGADNIAGRMHNIDIDFENNHIYGASDGGQIWRGDMNGENWISLTDNYHVKGVHFLRIMKPEEGSIRIMQANYDSLFMYSDNMGADWNISTGLDAMKNDRLTRAVSDLNNNIYLHFLRSNRSSYLYASSDKGESFELMDTHGSSRVSDIWISRYDSCPVFYLNRNELYSLNDEGKVEFISEIGINFSASEIERCQINGMVLDGVVNLAIMYRLDNSTRFFTSTDGGQTWIAKGSINEGPFMANSFGMSSLDPNVMGFGGVNSYRSFNGGTTWTLINGWGEYYGDIVNNLHADIPEIEFFRKPDGSEVVMVSTDGGSYISTDKLQTVKNISLSGLRTAQYYSTYTHRSKNQVIYAGSQDQGFQRSTQIIDGAASFEQTISGDYAHIVSGDGGRSLWTVYPGFAMYYPDAAGSNSNYRWDFTNSSHFWLPPLMEDPYFPEKVFLAGGTSTTGNHLWILEYKNSSISVSELPYDFSGGAGAWISAMAFSPINKDYRYVLNSRGKLYYSTDRSVNWTQSRTYGPGSHYFFGNSVIPDPRDINTIYIGGSGYSGYPVWVSKDGGRVFKGIGKGIPRTLVFEMAINEMGTLLFAATEVGPFVYIVSENQWYDLTGAGAPEQTYWSVDYIPSMRTARFGTYGRGIWDFKIEHLGKMGTGEEEDAMWVNSIGFDLYPNPASSSVNIEYHLLSTGSTIIILLDSSGKLIRNIDQGVKSAGSHLVNLNVADLSAGLYYLRVQSGNQVSIKKLIKQ
ncbi:MAG: T9SS type A sorting domain-containing protein [Bacteroidales bacterium]|nr:T9SS type A sorting domain-containing protein [Bacteroidales bacterium]